MAQTRLACGVCSGHAGVMGAVGRPPQSKLTPVILSLLPHPCRCLLHLWVCLSVCLWASDPRPLPWLPSCVSGSVFPAGSPAPVPSSATCDPCLPAPAFVCLVTSVLPGPSLWPSPPSVPPCPLSSLAPTLACLRHTAQQETNKTIAASTSTMRQMTELLRGCSRVCGPGGRGGLEGGRGRRPGAGGLWQGGPWGDWWAQDACAGLGRAQCAR